jgi:hypothetical protein
MTSVELIRELQAARPSAGEALRDRVQSIASQPPPSRRALFAGFSLRRGSLVALPAAAALALASAGAIGLARSGDDGRVASEPPTATWDAARGAPTESAQNQAAAPGGVRSAVKGAAPAVGPTQSRPQRYSAELTLEVSDAGALSDATQEALSIVQSLGGYAVSTSFDASGEAGAAALVVRVPTAKVQEALVRLSHLGTIVGQRVQIDDLGDQVDQLEQRERSLREQIARLTARLQSEPLDAETRAILESRRAGARSELADVRRTRAAVNREASLATISLALQTEEGAAVPAAPSRLDRALDRTVDILAWEGIALLYAAVVAGPFLLLAATVWAGSRVRRRREEERLLAAS